MNEQEVQQLKEQYEAAKIETQKAKELESKLKSQLYYALDNLFENNSRYFCPKCGKPTVRSGYYNERRDWMCCRECKNCGYYDAATFDRVETDIKWFNQCKEKEDGQRE